MSDPERKNTFGELAKKIGSLSLGFGPPPSLLEQKRLVERRVEADARRSKVWYLLGVDPKERPCPECGGEPDPPDVVNYLWSGSMAQGLIRHSPIMRACWRYQCRECAFVWERDRP